MKTLINRHCSFPKQGSMDKRKVGIKDEQNEHKKFASDLG